MSEAKWSLAADLQALNVPGRFFAPPLAGFVPDGISQDPFAMPDSDYMPLPQVYKFEDHYAHDLPNNRTTDVTLRVHATPLSGAFQVDPNTPDVPPPAIRLHAVATGRLRFNPGAAQLILETEAFAFINTEILKWFQRWVEADCVPSLVSYENVDVAHLENYLRNMPLDGQYGITFPDSDTAPIHDAPSRDAFVTAFLAGNGVLAVKASAVIGQMAPTSAGSPTFRLDLRVRYRNKEKEKDPTARLPMNPRELLYLMFGDQSKIATEHPLLRALNVLPPSVPKSTKTMILRPPLRTWARLKWEAEIEVALDQSLPAVSRYWSQAGALAPDSLFDQTFKRAIGGLPRGISYGSLKGSPKCNVFVSDVLVRAGFRVMIQESSTNNSWVYTLANCFAHAAVLAHRGKDLGAATPFPIMGDAPDASRKWGYARTKYLYDTIYNTEGIKQLNEMMTVEGRALIVAGARPKKKSGSSGTGHVVLLLEIDPYQPWPKLVANLDTDAQTLKGYPLMITELDMMDAAQAASEGDNAGARTGNCQMICGGKASNPGDSVGFIRIHLLEACPGGDPDLLHGLDDLHVRRRPPSQFNTTLDQWRP